MCPTEPRRERLAFCITDLDPGGAERALYHLVTRLDPARWEPAVFCLTSGGLLATQLQAAGIPVHVLDVAHAWQIPGAIWRLRNLLREWQPALVQTFLFHGNFVGRLAAWGAGAPLVISGIRVAEQRAKGHLWLDRWTQSLVNFHVCVSEAVAEFSASRGKLPREKLLVIRNGVEFERFAQAEPAALAEFGIPPGSQVVMSVGRLDPQKGLRTLIAAAQPLCARYATLHLLIVGEGAQRSELERELTHRQLTERVHLAGWRGDVPRLLRAAHLFVLPSLWEGLPNAVLEAMAAGLPVICSRVEGASELIEDRQSGILVSPGAADELRAAIAAALDDPVFAGHIAAGGQQRVREKFTWEGMAQQYAALYRRLIEALPPRAPFSALR